MLHVQRHVARLLVRMFFDVSLWRTLARLSQEQRLHLLSLLSLLLKLLAGGCPSKSAARKALQRISIDTSLTKCKHDRRGATRSPHSEAVREGSAHPRPVARLGKVRPRAGYGVGRCAEAGDGVRHARPDGGQAPDRVAGRGRGAGARRTAAPALQADAPTGSNCTLPPSPCGGGWYRGSRDDQAWRRFTADRGAVLRSADDGAAGGADRRGSPSRVRHGGGPRRPAGAVVGVARLRRFLEGSRSSLHHVDTRAVTIRCERQHAPRGGVLDRRPGDHDGAAGRPADARRSYQGTAARWRSCD